MKKGIIGVSLLLAIGASYFRFCTTYKLNEATFYKDNTIELKVVRFRENVFLHYNGRGTTFLVGSEHPGKVARECLK